MPLMPYETDDTAADSRREFVLSLLLTSHVPIALIAQFHQAVKYGGVAGV